MNLVLMFRNNDNNDILNVSQKGVHLPPYNWFSTCDFSDILIRKVNYTVVGKTDREREREGRREGNVKI